MNDETVMTTEEVTGLLSDEGFSPEISLDPADTDPLDGTRSLDGTEAEETDDGGHSEDSTEDIPDELELLRSEVATLRATLEKERAVYAKMNAECAEFSELYPDVPISSLSDDIWEAVKKGTPIAAAYALKERRAAVSGMRANEINRLNSQRSSGSIESPPAEEFFSPDEVRAMSPSQVRANYSKIINSMSKWH